MQTNFQLLLRLARIERTIFDEVEEVLPKQREYEITGRIAQESLI